MKKTDEKPSSDSLIAYYLSPKKTHHSFILLFISFLYSLIPFIHSCIHGKHRLIGNGYAM